MAMLASGLIFGMLFGFVIKRSRFCMTSLVRDIYLEKRFYNIVLIVAIVAVEGLIYHGLGHMHLVRIPFYLPPFSLLSIALGGLLFGVGAVVSCGCLTSTLVKCGDGRVAGLISLATFIVTGYFVSAGPGKDLSKYLRSFFIVEDMLPGRRSIVPVIVFAVLTVVAVYLLWRHRKTHPALFQVPGQYTGLRHILCEKIWPMEPTVVIIGVLMGLAFPVSGYFGRHFGFAIVSPILSWAYTAFPARGIVGSCNPYDTMFGWGSMFVLGIVLGSLLTTLASKEFSIVLPDKATALKMVAGGVLMGLGGVWGQGCLIANGLVGTAQLSMKSWYALVFLVLGVWLAARLILKPALKKG